MLHDYTAVSAETVTSEADAALARADALVDRAAARVDHPTFDGTLGVLDLAAAEAALGYGRGGFMGQVHPDAGVRDAGTAAEERFQKWSVALPFREDLYRAVRAFADDPASGSLTGERRRLLDHWLRDFRRAGHELEPEQRSELERLRERLVELEVAFQRNINEFRDGIDLTREQLDGLPESYIARLAPGDRPDTFRVTLDYPQLYPFLDRALDRGLREQLFRKHWNRAVETNRPLLQEALQVRGAIARLLGHPTWAHFAMEVKMAGAPERVRSFNGELVPRIQEATARDMAGLRERLAADGHGDEVWMWDWRFYDELLRRTEFGVDQEEVSEYLRLEQVLAGMFGITGEVFGLDYRQIREARAWHESVTLYEVHDRASGETIAHFYMDLFPREGKFGHAAAFPLVIGHRGADGEYVRPVSAIVANFTPPGAERPSLLQHSEVVTLFHEFGHILHMSLTRAEFARFSGAETEWDFVEAPSQIMEHWTWDPDVLARFARHYQTAEPLPPELVERLVAARNLNVGVRYAIQAFYGAIDLALHAVDAPPELDAALRDAYTVTGMPYPEGTFMLSGFGHLMGGYDAGYYGYLWANVIGDDMFDRFAREGVLSPHVGAAYRREILEPNGSRDADELVRAFLGRAPSNEAFLRLRGLAP